MNYKLLLLTCLMFAVLLSGCNGKSEDEKTSDVTTDSVHTAPVRETVLIEEADDYIVVEYETVTKDEYWIESNDLFDGVYQEDVIPTKEVAVKVAAQIFEGMSIKSVEDGFIPQIVRYDEENEIWVVTFWREQDYSSEVVILGYDFNIALRKSDGQVVKAWASG